MGARHISAVYANWSELPDLAFRMLCYMALIVPDANVDPRFYKGRRSLAFGIGRGVPDGQDLPKSTVQAVKRTIKTLTDTGAISNVHGGWRDQAAEYQLHIYAPKKGVSERTPLDPVDSPVDNPKGVTECTPSQSVEAGERGTFSDPERGTFSDPKGGHLVNERGSLTVPPGVTRKGKSTNEEAQSSTHSTPDGAGEPITPMSHFEVKEVLDAAAAEGVNVASLVASAPESLTKKSERRAWAAAQIVAKEAS